MLDVVFAIAKDIDFVRPVFLDAVKSFRGADDTLTRYQKHYI